MLTEKRKVERRDFSYYMRVTDEANGQPIGYLADIGMCGFKLDRANCIPIDKDFRLRIELTREVANKQSMVFMARSKWCHTDPIDSTAFNVGFQITNMTTGDLEIFSRMFEKYTSHGFQQKKSVEDYMWR
jgi:hypothetical protein